MMLSPDKKIAGILAPLFALRRQDDLGIGDLTCLRELIEWARENGFQLVQMLPVNELGGDNSPYNAISSVALEPTAMALSPGAPEELTQTDFQAIIANENLATLRQGPVKYRRVRRVKRALLECAFAHFRMNPTTSRRDAFARFCDEEAHWLEPYSLFRALMERNREREKWDEWEPQHRHPDTARSWLETQAAPVREQFRERQDFFRYVQWNAHEQWRAISRFSLERGVFLMGDIPFGVSYYSADVWADRQLFQLDWAGGAPPEPYFKDDEFTMKWGQNWGIPVYDWEEMRKRNFAWWRQRVRGIASIFQVFRIDHVLGFYRIYAFPWRPAENAKFLPLTHEQMLQETGGSAPHFVPRDDESAENCAANKAEGEEYLRMVLEESGATRVVGEDLGTVPKYVRPSLRALGIAGFKIPQWEVHDGRLTSGAEYERLSVATYATHDHKPIRELWSEAHDPQNPTREQAAHDLRTIAQFAGIVPRENLDYECDFYPTILRALFSSNSWLAIIMITDLLGRRDRFNVPGTARQGNWTHRLPKTIAQMHRSREIRKKMKLVRELIERSERN